MCWIRSRGERRRHSSVWARKWKASTSSGLFCDSRGSTRAVVRASVRSSSVPRSPRRGGTLSASAMMLNTTPRNSSSGVDSTSSSHAGTAKRQYKPWQNPPMPLGSASPKQASEQAKTVSELGGGSTSSRAKARRTLTPADWRRRWHHLCSCLRMSSSQ